MTGAHLSNETSELDPGVHVLAHLSQGGSGGPYDLLSDSPNRLLGTGKRTGWRGTYPRSGTSLSSIMVPKNY